MLEDRLGSLAKIQRDLDDAATLVELGEMEGDADTENEGLAQLRALKAEGERRQLEALLSGEADGLDSYVEVHSGAGGTESCDWARMLLRMYVRWGERRKFEVEVIEETSGDEAGIKSATIVVKGHNAHGWLKTESGVHRVQRVPDTEASGRIHTSTATVAVLPEAQEVDAEINDGDLKIDTMRSSGAGGQHVNKTESAIRITHLPTGVVVAMQEERSQHRNRAKAMALLRSRILDAQTQRANDERAQDRRSQVGSGDRSQRIRTYNFPQGRITDHRINLTLYALEKAMEGEGLDEIIDALTADRQAQLLAEQAER